jgi:hypothetical protein
MKSQVDRLVAGIAPDAGPGLTPGALELFEEIATGSATSPEPAATTDAAVHSRRSWSFPGRARRWRSILPLAAGLAVVAIVATWMLPSAFGLGPRPAAAALDIKQESGYYVITVKDLFADPKLYQSQLRAKGLDISLEVQPVSPSVVGSIFPPFDMRYNGLSFEELTRRKDLISPIQRPGACAESLSCTIGLRVPVDYRGKAVIELGRKARQKERYRAWGVINNPGEPLQCVGYVNKSVDQVRAMLAERGVTIGRFAVPLRGLWPSVPGSWFVHEGWLSEQGKALLVAAPTRIRTPFPMSESCPKTT